LSEALDEVDAPGNFRIVNGIEDAAAASCNGCWGADLPTILASNLASLFDKLGSKELEFEESCCSTSSLISVLLTNLLSLIKQPSFLLFESQNKTPTSKKKRVFSKTPLEEGLYQEHNVHKTDTHSSFLPSNTPNNHAMCNLM
jgi:hypothetical protein